MTQVAVPTQVPPAKRARGHRVILGVLVATLVFAFAAPRANAFVYWANFGAAGSGGGTTLGRANLDGSGVNESFITGASGPSLPALDASHIYWTDFNTNAVSRGNLDGTGVNHGFITGASAPLGTAVDGAHVYWANCGSPSCPGATIGRANLDGTGVNQSFVTGQSVDAVAVDAAHIYWSDFQGGTIGRANIDGSGANNNFITGAIKPGGVAVDATHIYWVNWNEGGGTTIGRANLDGSGVNQSFITGASGPCGVAVDSNHIYWANFNTNAIGRANLDGSGVNQSFITGANGPCGVAVDGPPTAVTGVPLVNGPTTAVLRGTGNPGTLRTTGRWIFGLDASERGPGWGGNVFDQSTPAQNLGSDSSSHSISFPVSGLMPNARYHVKFETSNSAGTTMGADQVFTTPPAHVSPVPPLGSGNFTPSGTIFVLVNGRFVKLTQTLQLPSGTEVDALHGSLTLVVNSGAGRKASDARAKKPKKPKTFTGTFSGAVFKVTQAKSGANRGRTTITLVDVTPAFPGAPSYTTTCRAHGSADAGAARLSRRVIYTLRSRSRGRWGSRGRYAAGTVGGTVWTTTDRCDGTLVSVRIDKVLVSDLVRHIKILLHAGQHYLALAHPPKKHK